MDHRSPRRAGIGDQFSQNKLLPKGRNKRLAVTGQITTRVLIRLEEFFPPRGGQGHVAANRHFERAWSLTIELKMATLGRQPFKRSVERPSARKRVQVGNPPIWTKIVRRALSVLAMLTVWDWSSKTAAPRLLERQLPEFCDPYSRKSPMRVKNFIKSTNHV